MRNLFRQLCCLIAISVLAIGTLRCEEPNSNENAIQETLNTLLVNLEAAVGGSNESALENIISTAQRLRPSSPTQTQSKNLLLSTARGKLAQIKFQSVSVEVNVVVTKLHLARNQASQVAALRSAASSFTAAGQPYGDDLGQTIASTVGQLRSTYDKQLREAMERIESLQFQSEAARSKAIALRDTADTLLNEAEETGLIEGHKTFKAGVRTMRHSQQVEMSAASVELESHMQAQPLAEDAKAELEAIASILDGVQHTGELLQQLRESSIQSAADLRRVADELDNETAATMNEAIVAAGQLTQKWDEATSLIQDAMQGSGRQRNTSGESQQAAAMWKLDMEWTLGHIEESKRQFLLEELQVLFEILEYGIVTTASKWQELSNTVASAVELATISAISAYENAKQLAGSAGTHGDTLAFQLDSRIALLQGQALPEARPVTDATPTSQPFSGSSQGFATPQELIEAFNVFPSLAELDGTSPAPDFTVFYDAQDEPARKFVDFMQRLSTAGGDFLIAIRTHIGVEAIEKYMAQTPDSASMKIDIDPSSLIMEDNNNAKVVDITGKQITLKKTPVGWKIILKSGGDAEGVEFAVMMLEMMAPMIDVMNDLTLQINDGQITTFEQIEAAFESAAPF